MDADMEHEPGCYAGSSGTSSAGEFLPGDVECTCVETCPHHSARVETGGWTFDADPESPYYGRWVHGDLACRKPKFLTSKEN